MEGEGGLQGDGGRGVAGGEGVGDLGLDGVVVCYVGLVVFGVVKLHYAAAYGGLEGTVVIWVGV